MSAISGRRSFVSTLASLAGLSVVGSATTALAAQAAGTPGGQWDLSWMDQLKGQHKQLYDLSGINLAEEGRPLRFGRNFLDTFRDVYKLEFPAINTAVGVNNAVALNASDQLWAKYRLGERYKIVDPATKAPAVRNVFMDDPQIGIKAMQARGTAFWQCNVALSNIAQQLADANKLPVADVRADLVAGLNPGVHLVPSHVMALALMQERGFTYMKV